MKPAQLRDLQIVGVEHRKELVGVAGLLALSCAQISLAVVLGVSPVVSVCALLGVMTSWGSGLFILHLANGRAELC